ncbi:unnamed protein product [Caenorhabditis angaria]|uniref:Vps16 C-terminal domain-containing protein n=1 Tax=Caenorhabditis angaria TaxID=860376 RepID=A0A9P1N5L9_9PELO|nr:unnamed protein product [Caenorhabditis angaria]
MTLRRKFTFDNPEDSYWNESDSNSSSLFDDLQSKQLQARAAVDNLFGGDETPKPKNPSPLPPQTSEKVRLTNASPKASGKLVDDFLSMKFVEKVKVAAPAAPPSVVSEASASSLPSEAQRLDLDYSRLKAEHRKLQQHLETVRHDRFRPLNVEKAIERMIEGNEVSLDNYRSYNEKHQLIESASNVHDNNILFKVVIFLEKSLKEPLFFKLMATRKEACRVYVNYLQILKEWDKMKHFLRGIGRYQHAAIVEFEATRKYRRNPDKRVPLLRTMLHGSFSIPEMKFEAKQIENLMRNYEIQLQIEKYSNPKSEVFSKFPKQSSLLGLPALSTLYYSALYHYDDPQTSPTSINFIRQSIRFNDRLAIQTIVSSLVRQSRWPDVDKLLQVKPLAVTLNAAKNVFKGKKVTSKWNVAINNHNLLTIIKRSHAEPPPDFIFRILRGEGDSQERLRLALLFDVPEMVIECMTQKGDRTALASYAKSLRPNSVESFKAIAALNNTAIKWK